MAKNRARRSSPLYLPSAFDLFKPSRDLVIENIHVFGWLFLLPLFFWIHSWIWIPATSGHYWSRFTDANYSWPIPASFSAAFIGISIFWFLIAVIAGTLVQVMSQKAQLDASSGKTPQFGELWQTAKRFWLRMLGLYVCMALLMIFGLFLLAGRYLLAPYVLLEQNCTIGEALKKSAALSEGRRGSVWGLLGVILLISLAGIIPLIGSLAAFILGSLYSVAPALRYRQLKKLA